MRMLKETSGSQTIYKLKDAEIDEALGEAVVSEIHNGLRLHGIFVKPKFRGKGYGTFIMNAILREAQTKRVTLCTGLGNIAFFKQFGFEVIDIGDSLVSMEKKPVNNKFLNSLTLTCFHLLEKHYCLFAYYLRAGLQFGS